MKKVIINYNCEFITNFKNALTFHDKCKHDIYCEVCRKNKFIKCFYFVNLEDKIVKRRKSEFEWADYCAGNHYHICGNVSCNCTAIREGLGILYTIHGYPLHLTY